MDTSRITVNCSILLTDLPLLMRAQAARDAGFGAVEFWWPFDVAVPQDRDVDAFVAAIEDAGVQLSGLNFFAGNMPAGDRGILTDDGLGDLGAHGEQGRPGALGAGRVLGAHGVLGARWAPGVGVW